MLPLLASSFAALASPARVAAAVLVPLVAAGCASYPERTRDAFHAFQGGHFDSAASAYADPDTTGSDFLSGAEAGTAALCDGDWDGALEHFHRASRSVEDLEGRALVSASSLAETIGSWALNDTALPYRGEGFERVYVHCALAMAYLARGLFDDVWVEVQLANKLLESEEELYETEYRAGGLGHFLSALAYEMSGRLDDAYIDYRRMVDKGVGTELAGRALVRISEDLGWSEDLERWEADYGPPTPRPLGAASIVVLGGVGTGPFKVEASFPVPTPDGVIPFSAAGYERRGQPVSGLRLRLGADTTVRTDVLEHVSDIAEENLEDRVLWMAAKSVARGVVKRELTKSLQNEFDLAGRIAGDLFAVMTERADLRAWQTLPDSWQAARMFVAPGVHDLRLEAIGGDEVHLGAFQLEEGETMILLARTVETRLYAHAIGGLPVDAPIP
ncbi:MAG: hypothetical protein AAF682_03520 [Planctomycetota bacterium]